MAANSSCRIFVKRFVTQISTQSPARSAPALRRSVHSSVYDKNVEDDIRPAVVPDGITQPESEKFWAPNPNNGVFGPAAEHNLASGEGRGYHASNANGGIESVLEIKTFFRSLEDLEKPQHP